MGSDSAGPTGPQRAFRGGPTEAALLLYLLRLLGLQVQGVLPPSPVPPPPSLLLLSPQKEVVSCPLETLPTGSSVSRKEIHPDWGLMRRALIFVAFLDLPLRPAGLFSLTYLDTCSLTHSQSRPQAQSHSHSSPATALQLGSRVLWPPLCSGTGRSPFRALNKRA